MKTEIINKLKNLEFITHSDIRFPTYKTTDTNSFFFGTLFGTRGSGKTTVIFNLLEIERDIMLKGDNLVYFFSGTKDDKVNAMIKKYPDNFIYIDGLDKDRFDEVKNTISEITEDWYAKHAAYKLIKKLVDAKFNLKIFDSEQIRQLEENNFYIDVDWATYNHQHPPISTIIFDDLAGNPLLNGTGKEAKYFYSFALKHRHAPYHCNLFLLAQYPKSISRAVRSQQNFVIQFNGLNTENLKMMFSEYSALFKHKMQNYVDVLQEIERRANRSFMLLYYDSKKFVRMNFNEEVSFD